MLEQIPTGSCNTIVDSRENDIRTESVGPCGRETSLLPPEVCQKRSRKKIIENYFLWVKREGRVKYMYTSLFQKL